MRTTLNLDENALTSAMEVVPGRAKAAVINDALREYACRHRIRRFLELEGRFHWEGDLDQLRKREPASE